VEQGDRDRRVERQPDWRPAVVAGLQRRQFRRGAARAAAGYQTIAPMPASRSITLAMEPGFQQVECFGPDNRCAITRACRLQAMLASALAEFFGVLDRPTLADLLDPPPGPSTTRRRAGVHATGLWQAP
jgi:hypothetical protein